MIASGHNGIGTTIGLIVAQNSQDPVKGIFLGFFLGLIFHYLTDFIPHGHYLTHKSFGKLPLSLFADLFGSFLIFYGIVLFKFGFSSTSLIILAAIGGSQLPDVSEGLLYFKKIPKTLLIKWENDMHQKFFHWHGHHEKALPWNFRRDVWQIGTILIALLILLAS